MARIAKELQDDVESLDSVLEAGIAGNRDEMVEVVIHPLRLEAYNVTASGDTRFDLFVDEGFGLERRFATDFVADEDGTARVVTYSAIDERGDCGIAGCFPSGQGDATIRIRQAGRQSLSQHATTVSGEWRSTSRAAVVRKPRMALCGRPSGAVIFSGSA